MSSETITRVDPDGNAGGGSAEGEGTPEPTGAEATETACHAERAAPPPPNGAPARESVGGLTSSQIAEDIYRRNGWVR